MTLRIMFRRYTLPLLRKRHGDTDSPGYWIKYSRVKPGASFMAQQKDSSTIWLVKDMDTEHIAWLRRGEASDFSTYIVFPDEEVFVHRFCDIRHIER